MRTFEIWQVKDEEGKFLYDSRYDKNCNIYKFYTEQRTTKKAIEKVKEIFKNSFKVEKFLNEEFAGDDYLFSVNIDGSIENYIMFEVR